MTAQQDAAVRDAIAVMTAWVGMADANSNAFAIDTVLHVAEDRYPGDPAAGYLHLVGGLGALCGLLLAQRQAEAGVSMEGTLRDFGQRWAGRGE